MLDKDSAIVDQLLRSTETLRARKEAGFVDMERPLVDAMYALAGNLARCASCCRNVSDGLAASGLG